MIQDDSRRGWELGQGQAHRDMVLQPGFPEAPGFSALSTLPSPLQVASLQSSTWQDVSSLHLPVSTRTHPDCSLFWVLCASAWPTWLSGLAAGAHGAKTGFLGLPACISGTLCSNDELRCCLPGVLIKGPGSSWLLFLLLNLELKKSDIKQG